jgi:DNA-binding NtrC family response regulator
VVIIGWRGSQAPELAKYIYTRQTPATAWPLVPLECRLLDAELLTTTVVSYVRSHWQWADPERVVLLLLEVERLSDDAQWALWELLQRPRPRWHTLSTTEQNLLSLADRGQFRSDLACYLSSAVLEVPRLQQRVEDFPWLVQRLLESHAAQLPRPVTGISPEALEKLQHYSWPGEWEQFESLVLEAARRCQSGQIELQDLPPVLTHAEQAMTASGAVKRPEPVHLDRLLEEYEATILRRALRLARGNRARAARLVGISRARLLRRIEQLKLQADAPPDSPASNAATDST